MSVGQQKKQATNDNQVNKVLGEGWSSRTLAGVDCSNGEMVNENAQPGIIQAKSKMARYRKQSRTRGRERKWCDGTGWM